MNLFNPYQYNYNQLPNNMYTNQSYNDNHLIRVTGLDGAKAYQMQPNSTIALFDNNEDLMYIKTTDGAGFPTIRTFKFEELTNFLKNSENVVDTEQFITKKEFEQFKEEFINGKYFVSEQKSKSESNKCNNSVTKE